MGDIASLMPLIASMEGVWDGEYVHLDADHQEFERHRSRLVCHISDNDRLIQSNIYDWPDGTREIRYFEGVLTGDRLLISNENIDGWVAPLVHDATGRTIMVLWTRAGAPDFRFYEMITVSENGLAKNRTWHWYEKGRLFQRTLINEQLVTRDWQAHDAPEYHAYRSRAPL
jgi:hypothetical protein